MNNRWIRIGILLLVLCVATPVWAQGGGIVPGGGGKIIDPLGGVTIEQFIENIITFLLGLVGILALLALVWGGFQYILGFTDEKKVEHGKEIIKWAIIGIILVTISYAIIKTVSSLLGIT